MVLNDASSLTREWIAIDDTALPARFEGLPGVTTVFEQNRGYSGDYWYKAKVGVVSSAELSAIEVRYVVIDVFGNHQRTLSLTRVADIKADSSFVDDGKWRLYSETDASTAFTSIAYIAAVRTRDGRVLKANLPKVLEEIRKISATIEEGQIGREAPPKPGA